MNDQSLLQLMTLIALLCNNDLNKQQCVQKYNICLAKNHHPEVWATRMWGCIADLNYPDDSGDKK